MGSPDRYVTIQQLIEEDCAVSQQLVRYRIKHEGLPIHRGSKKITSKRGKILIRLSEFDAWMDQRRKERNEIKYSVSPKAQKFAAIPPFVFRRRKRGANSNERQTAAHGSLSRLTPDSA